MNWIHVIANTDNTGCDIPNRLRSHLNHQNMFGWRGINKPIVITICLILCGIVVAFTTNTASIDVLYLLMAVYGITNTGITILLVVWIADVWAKDSGPYMQAFQFTTSLAGIVGPLVVAPYLPSNIGPTDDTTADISAIKWTLSIPYLIIGIITAVNAIPFGLMLAFNSSQLMPTKLIFVMIIMCGSIKALLYGIQEIQLTNITKFSTEVGLTAVSTQYSAYFSTCISGATAASQALAIPLARYIRPLTMLWMGIFLQLLSQILLLFAHKSVCLALVLVLYLEPCGNLWANSPRQLPNRVQTDSKYLDQ
ncbi:unnamed protein product [Medioppia subpectinata]|uniref:Uncharacterized protein n=1 Tax=Medioppia subpectinata TaxID=1979941 RepID=A0A7R9KM72_9ACAR|nr:unnamed protein product [Medioppia subpectinata]CAG2105830.1 unnamed protein product [Medioppia subpectinata]